MNREAADPWAQYDPAKLRAGLTSSINTLFSPSEAAVALLRIMPEGGLQAMATVPKTVRVTAETALPELLDDAAQEPIMLERDGERCRLSRDEDIAGEPDPAGVRAMLAATAGSWADLDVDEMI